MAGTAGYALARGAALTIASAAIVAVSNYALNIGLGWTLSVDDYGRVAVSQTLIFVSVWFLGAGFPWVVSRAVARAGDDEEAHVAAWRTYRTAWVSNAMLTLIIVSLLLLSFRAGWLRLDRTYSEPLDLVAITTMALGISAVPSAALQGLLRFGGLAIVRLLEAVVNLIVSLGLVMLGLGATGALAGFAGSAVLACGYTLWLLRDRPPWHGAGWDGLSTLRAALPMTTAVFGAVLLTNLDVLAVKFLTPQDHSDALSGAYQVAAALARAPLFVGTALIGVFYPHIAAEARQGRMTVARELLRWLLLAVLPLNTVMAVGARAVVLFFFPATYVSAAPSLLVLSLGSSGLICASALAAIHQANQRTRAPALIMAGAVSVQLSALSLLVPAYGLIGAASASTLASVLACVLLMGRPSAWRYLRPPFANRQVLALTLLALMALPLLGPLANASRLLVGAYVCAILAVYFVICLMGGLLDASALLPLFRDREHPGARLVQLIVAINGVGRRASLRTIASRARPRPKLFIRKDLE